MSESTEIEPGALIRASTISRIDATATSASDAASTALARSETALDSANAALDTATEAESTANKALPLIGGSLTGPLTLSANPTSALGAATKAYVDNALPLGGPYLPITGGILEGPLTLAADRYRCSGQPRSSTLTLRSAERAARSCRLVAARWAAR